ncbi:hypothetical protein VNO77_27302 [Canavalia gladiata]|uniref:Uncharacterized protein n=1 Tax=Canavalia gladiata TaxID=3824 RepID=A0AAN9Q6C3_CANGL
MGPVWPSQKIVYGPLGHCAREAALACGIELEAVHVRAKHMSRGGVSLFISSIIHGGAHVHLNLLPFCMRLYVDNHTCMEFQSSLITLSKVSQLPYESIARTTLLC